MLGGLLAAGIAVAAVLSARARRRRRWLQQLESAEADVVWLARELLPQLRDGGSPERVAGGWEVGLPRVGAVEDQLTVLEASARAEEDAVRARALRDAVRGARARVDALTAGGPQEQWALELDEAIALLESALATSTQPG